MVILLLLFGGVNALDAQNDPFRDPSKLDVKPIIAGVHTLSIHVRDTLTHDSVFQFLFHKLGLPVYYTPVKYGERKYVGLYTGNMVLEPCGPYQNINYATKEFRSIFYGLNFEVFHSLASGLQALRRLGMTYQDNQSSIYIKDSILCQDDVFAALYKVADKEKRDSLRSMLLSNDSNNPGLEYIKEIHMGFRDEQNLQRWMAFFAPLEFNNNICQVNDSLQIYFTRDSINRVMGITFKVKSLEMATRWLQDNDIKTSTSGDRIMLDKDETYGLEIFLSEQQTEGRVDFHNLTSDFTEFFDMARELPGEKQIEIFKTRVYPNAPQVYDRIFKDIEWMGQKPEERIVLSIEHFDSIKDQFVDISNQLESQIETGLSSFLIKFSDLTLDFDVYIMHSLGIRAGGIIQTQNRTALMFGVDQIIKHLDFENFTPFFHHELTHLYHSFYYTPRNQGKYSEGAIYNELWREGLAVYVSRALNPEAKENEVFMRENISVNTEKVLNLIAKDIRENLYSSNTELFRKYFWESSTDTIVPKTAGYYMGYLLVKEIAKEYPINELIQLTEDDFVPKFELILDSLSL